MQPTHPGATNAPHRPRAVYPIADVARITGGRLVQAHCNWCPALAEQPGACTCVAEWRLIMHKGGHSR